MTPNGRRAWRRAAKKLRRKMGRRWRSQEEWVYGKRWSELVPDLEAHRAHVTGAWFKRHGVTEQGPEKLDAQHLVRVYVGLWGTVDGDSVTYAMKPESFTARSIVGMTMGARKRAWEMMGYLRSDLRIGERLRPCPGCWHCQTTWQQSSLYPQTAVVHRHGCSHDDPSGVCCFGETISVTMECDGSGVLPARRP